MNGEQSFFSKLPNWARILFVIFYPVSIPYGIYRMWRMQKFSQVGRIALTAAGALFLMVALAMGSTGGSPPSSEVAEPMQAIEAEPIADESAEAAAAEKAAAGKAAAEKAAAEKAAAEKAAAEKAAAEKAAAEKAAAEKAAAEKAAAEKAAAEAAAAEKAAAGKAAAEKAGAEKAAAEKAAAEKAAAAAAPAASSGGEVYITNTGTKYHKGGCSSLSESKIPISLADAKAQGYEACKRCY